MIREFFSLVSGGFKLLGQGCEALNTGLDSLNQELQKWNAEMRKNQLCEFYGKDSEKITSEEFIDLVSKRKALESWLHKNNADDLIFLFSPKLKKDICQLYGKSSDCLSDEEYLPVAKAFHEGKYI